MDSELATLIENYEILPENVELVRTTPILLLVGVAGAGKDSIIRQLLKSGDYHEIVSHTTRQPRSNNGVLEQDGVSYHFIDVDIAKRMLAAREFVEAKLVHDRDVYGTSIAELQKAKADGKIAVTDLDVQGVAEYKELSKNVIAVFILPPNYDEWIKRLQSRYGDVAADNADVQRRMHTAIAELSEALGQPYYHFVVNENLDEAVKAVNSIAHHHDEFTTIDRSFRVWAEHLLAELQSRQ
jgi:guanylate kinase